MKPKILYSEIVQSPQFFLDSTEHFFPEATTFMLTGEKLDYLCILFNSQPITYFFKTFYAGGGLGEHVYRYKKLFLEHLPIPRNPSNNLIYKLVNLKDNKIVNELIYKMYDLSVEEITFIESTFI